MSSITSPYEKIVLTMPNGNAVTAYRDLINNKILVPNGDHFSSLGGNYQLSYSPNNGVTTIVDGHTTLGTFRSTGDLHQSLPPFPGYPTPTPPATPPAPLVSSHSQAAAPAPTPLVASHSQAAAPVPATQLTFTPVTDGIDYGGQKIVTGQTVTFAGKNGVSYKVGAMAKDQNGVGYFELKGSNGEVAGYLDTANADHSIAGASAHNIKNAIVNGTPLSSTTSKIGTADLSAPYVKPRNPTATTYSDGNTVPFDQHLIGGKSFNEADPLYDPRVTTQTVGGKTEYTVPLGNGKSISTYNADTARKVVSTALWSADEARANSARYAQTIASMKPGESKVFAETGVTVVKETGPASSGNFFDEKGNVNPNVQYSDKTVTRVYDSEGNLIGASMNDQAAGEMAAGLRGPEEITEKGAGAGASAGSETSLGQRMKSNPMALVGMIGGGFSLFALGMALGNLQEGQSAWTGIVSLVPSVTSFMQGFDAIFKWGVGYSAMVAGLIMALGYWLGHKKKKDNEEGGPGDVPPVPATQTTPTSQTTSANGQKVVAQEKKYAEPKPWYKSLGSKNVFMITSAAALMALGLNLGLEGPSDKSIAIKASELTGWRNALDTSVGGGKLPGIGTGVLGKVFIQSSENNGVTPDKVVYVSQDSMPTKDKAATYSVNMLSLNYKGAMVGPNDPSDSYVPIFERDANGAVVATRAGNDAIGRVRAYSMAAASNVTSPDGSVAAAHNGGAADNSEVENK